MVSLRLFTREYERTCRECGYSWRVPRGAVRQAKKFTGGGMRVSRGTTITGQMGMTGISGMQNNVGARAEVMEAYRICAKCGVDDFAQRPVPRQALPPDGRAQLHWGGTSIALRRSFICVWTAALAASTRWLNDLILVREVALACLAVSVTRAWLAWISASAMTEIWGVNVTAASGTGLPAPAALVISPRARLRFWGVNVAAARSLSSVCSVATSATRTASAAVRLCLSLMA